jgi:hypothetical protein
MPSEYDFLSTYSRRLRRTATLLIGAGAVLAGAVSMALVIALPLQPRSNAETTVRPAKSAPVAGPSQEGAQPVTDTAVNTATGNFETQNSAQPRAAGVAINDASNPQTADAPTLPLPQSIRDRTPSETKKTNEPTPPTERENGSTATRGHREKTVATTPERSATSADRRQPRAERPAGAAKRTVDRDTTEQKPVRPEPFSIQEFFASHR